MECPPNLQWYSFRVFYLIVCSSSLGIPLGKPRTWFLGIPLFFCTQVGWTSSLPLLSCTSPKGSCPHKHAANLSTLGFCLMFCSRTRSICNRSCGARTPAALRVDNPRGVHFVQAFVPQASPKLPGLVLFIVQSVYFEHHRRTGGQAFQLIL